MKKRTIISGILISALIFYGSYIISSAWETDISTVEQGVTTGSPRTGEITDSDMEKLDRPERDNLTGMQGEGEEGIDGEDEGVQPEELSEGEERIDGEDDGEQPEEPGDGEEENSSRGIEKVSEEPALEAFSSAGESIKADRSETYPTQEQQFSLLDRVDEYVVKKGDTLWEIARDHKIDIDTIIGANDITNMNRIKPGDVLKILPVKGIVYRVSPGENLWIIARQFKISLDVIVEANLISHPDLVKPGKILVLPGAKPEFGYLERLQQKLIKPVTARISSHFGGRWGRMHEGIDYAVNTGTGIKAASSGKVIYSGWASGYGKTVIIEHRKGLRTLYAHNSKLLVNSGQWVERGQIITRSGNTGNSTGPHLHFEVQINGKPVNPLSYIK